MYIVQCAYSLIMIFVFSKTGLQRDFKIYFLGLLNIYLGILGFRHSPSAPAARGAWAVSWARCS